MLACYLTWHLRRAWAPLTFTDPRLCAAIVDRLTFDAHIITTGTDSYRLRTAQARHQSARTG